MKRLRTGVLLAAALIFSVPVIAEARGGGRGGGTGGAHSGAHSGGHGGSRGGHYYGGGRAYYYAAPIFAGAYFATRYYYPPAYYYPPPYYPQVAPEYIEQPIPYSVPPQGQAQPDSQAYWYYCQASRAYYPHVQSCPGGWQRMAPQAPPR